MSIHEEKKREIEKRNCSTWFETEEDLEFLWREYALIDDDELTKCARKTKYALLKFVKKRMEQAHAELSQKYEELLEELKLSAPTVIDKWGYDLRRLRERLAEANKRIKELEQERERMQKQLEEKDRIILEACEVMEEECMDICELACNERKTYVGFYREDDVHTLTEEEWCKWCKIREKLRALVEKKEKKCLASTYTDGAY